MEAKFSKRLFAYIIDVLILGIILLICSFLIPENKKIIELNVELDTLNEELLSKEITIPNYIHNYSEIILTQDKENVIYMIINIVFIIVYFVILPYILKGQTLGKKLFKIKVTKENEKLSIVSLLIRNLIINGLGYAIIILMLMYILPSLAYLIISVILGLTQIIVIIISSIMIIKNDNHLGLHDKLANTKVVDA